MFLQENLSQPPVPLAVRTRPTHVAAHRQGTFPYRSVENQPFQHWDERLRESAIIDVFVGEENANRDTPLGASFVGTFAAVVSGSHHRHMTVRNALFEPSPETATLLLQQGNLTVTFVPKLVNGNEPPKSTELLDWVVAMDKRVQLMSSVGTGASIIARAGALDGQPAATKHEAFAWVSGFGPNVLWDNVARWVDAGHYVTSAGVSAGTDMAFHLVSRLAAAQSRKRSS